MKVKKSLKKLMAFVLAMVMFCASTLTTFARDPGVTGPEGRYPDVDAFAQSPSIKGMQGVDKYTWDKFGGLYHGLQNLRMDKCILTTDHEWVQKGYIAPYEFEGENFYFYFEDWLFPRIKELNDKGITISIVLLMGWDGNANTSFMIEEGSRVAGYNYYAPAITGYGEKTMRAFYTRIMDYCEEWNCHIDNLILGNEVNMPNQWHYSGSSDPNTCATKYAEAFYDMYSVVRQYSENTRCSISIDHSWNNNDEGRGVAAREFLHLFNNHLAQLQSDVDWCVSAHLYPAVLYETDIWAYLGHDFPFELNPKSADARIIDGNNLYVMTNYIRDNFGEEHRVMLTEQGFTSYMGAEYQAAALAYSYYAALYDSMVDCFIIVNEDHDGASSNKLNFTIDGTLAGDVYTKLENGNAEDAAWIDNTILPIIGVNSWSEIVPNYGNETTKPFVKEGLYNENGVRILYKENVVDTSYTGWYTDNGEKFWLQNGVETRITYAQPGSDQSGWYREGNTLYWLDAGEIARDKEVYDPASDAWYWFDLDGTMATNKDAFVPTNAERTEGKWVRYDENGGMIKGEQFYNGGWYRFDWISGEMIKGWFDAGDGKMYYYDPQWGTRVHGLVEIEDIEYAFNNETGAMLDCEWYVVEGAKFWYEDGVRQGLEGRGKEIYDPASDAWYWLDAVDDGKMAVSKDVYQESEAGDWGDIKGDDGKLYGKWVRYDENGHMIKGWSADGLYYFDVTYGTMAKGTAVIDGVTYTFDTATGVRK